MIYLLSFSFVKVFLVYFGKVTDVHCFVLEENTRVSSIALLPTTPHLLPSFLFLPNIPSSFPIASHRCSKSPLIRR